MGVASTKLFSRNKEARILVLGDTYAGKTTIINRLQPGQEDAPTIPTIAFNVVTLNYNDTKFEIYDMGRYFWDRSEQASRRPYSHWRHYFPTTQAIIFVVDSSPSEMKWLAYAKEDIHILMGEEGLKDAFFVIFANKQDVPGALDDAKITEALELHKIENRNWAVFTSCATNGEGVFQGIDWLCDKLKSVGHG